MEIKFLSELEKQQRNSLESLNLSPQKCGVKAKQISFSRSIAKPVNRPTYDRDRSQCWLNMKMAKYCSSHLRTSNYIFNSNFHPFGFEMQKYKSILNCV